MKKPIDHDANKHYHEYIAKCVLEKYFPYLFSELSMEDAPDLRTPDGRGVEVTWAVNHTDAESSFLLSKIINLTLEDADPKIVAKLEKLDQSLLFYPGTKRIIGCSPEETSQGIEELTDISSDKIDKTRQYKMETDLFIFTPMMGFYDDEEIKEYILWMKEAQKYREHIYKTVFIFDYEHIWKCDILTSRFVKTRIEKSDIDGIIDDALSKYYK
ncbi:MAG: hypothetical protein IJI66_16645 [Erysipelotrichaceae bacterium]|nr:hypothetical protein [Oscillospiraceae bacterium]MBR0420792.1 hypothetical protein [Erysipelotrichaceae bacterium]